MRKRNSSNYSLWPEQAGPRRAIPFELAACGFAIEIVSAAAVYNVVTYFLRPISIQQVARESAVEHVPINTTATTPVTAADSMEPGSPNRSRRSAAKVALPTIGTRGITPSPDSDGRGETDDRAGDVLKGDTPRLPLSQSRRSKIPSPPTNHRRRQAHGKLSMSRVSVEPTLVRHRTVRKKRERPRLYVSGYRNGPYFGYGGHVTYVAGTVASMLGRSGKHPRSNQPVESLQDSNSSRLTEVLVFMRSFLSALLMIACAALLGEGACAESAEPPAAAGKQADDKLAPPPPTPDDRARHDEAATAEKPANDEHAGPPATDGDRVKRDEEAVATSSSSEVGNAPSAELSGFIDSVCVIVESAATANGLPLEFFARVIWEESRFQLNAVGPTTSTGHRAQGIAQFMPYTAAQRGLLDPFDPKTALPEAAEFLAELRSEFGNLGLAAAAYNAGPGRVRDFIDKRGSMPAQTRNYVRAITGRSVDEWVVLGRDGGKDGIAKPISCHQLATLLKERPSFVIGRVERKAREAALRPQRISDLRNTSSGQNGTRRVAAPPTRSPALARNRNPSQVRAASLPTTGRPIRQPSTSLLAAAGKSGKSAGAVSRSRSKASTLPNSGPASGRLPASSRDGIGRKHSATRVATRPTASAVARNRKPLPVRAASLPTTETRRAKTSPSPAESRNSSTTPGKKGKSTGTAGRATSVAFAPSSSQARVVSSELVAREKIAEDRLRKIMQICRGC